ncbi:hypothetical protein ACWC9Q_23480 [Streptomyces sp. NPDC001142]
MAVPLFLSGRLPAAHEVKRPAPADAAVVAAVRDRVAAGYYVPGSRLTLDELSVATGYTSAQLRPALEHLAGEQVVYGRWRVPGDQPVERTRRLLVALISHGAYPPAPSFRRARS